MIEKDNAELEVEETSFEIEIEEMEQVSTPGIAMGD